MLTNDENELNAFMISGGVAQGIAVMSSRASFWCFHLLARAASGGLSIQHSGYQLSYWVIDLEAATL